LKAEVEFFKDVYAAEERAGKEGWVPLEEVRKRFNRN